MDNEEKFEAWLNSKEWGELLQHEHDRLEMAYLAACQDKQEEIDYWRSHYEAIQINWNQTLDRLTRLSEAVERYCEPKLYQLQMNNAMYEVDGRLISADDPELKQLYAVYEEVKGTK